MNDLLHELPSDIHEYIDCKMDDMIKLYGYDRMTMVYCLIKGYIENTQSRIVIVIYKHIVMYITI